jgi:hypothetical protein
MPRPITPRPREAVTEILAAADVVGFDPSANFRARFGQLPWHLLAIVETMRVGLEIVVQAKSISPMLDEPVFIIFTSAKEAPLIGDFMSFYGGEVSILSRRLQPKRYKAREISKAEFDSLISKGKM